ncbi:hypothetical protein H0H92_008303 [Tricholoma furcatifolium]|nr:hypothetical protein H0H92_008303 [Tricholoma furcatifolium]
MKLSASFTALVSLVTFVTAKAVLPPPHLPAHPSTAVTPTNSAGLPISTSKVHLNEAAHMARKLYFGPATDNGELSDEPYVAILRDNTEFGQITPMFTESERGVFNFTQAEQIVRFAQHNGQILRDSWDVINGVFKLRLQLPVFYIIWSEPFNDDGTWRETMFYETLNTSYIPLALRAARAADPHAKLYINDYNIEGPGAKSTAMINLVKDLKREGVPIDGVGIQGHLIVCELPSNIEENLYAITEAGVEVAITELDIRMNLPVTAALLEQQKADYETVIKACKNYSWVPGVFAGQGAPCPWDENLQRKPAYDGIALGFTN